MRFDPAPQEAPPRASTSPGSPTAGADRRRDRFAPAPHPTSWNLVRRALRLLALEDRDPVALERLARLRRDERRIRVELGRPLRRLRILALGDGDDEMDRAPICTLGLHNEVHLLRPTSIEPGPGLRELVHVLRRDGIGGLAERAGRALLGGERALRRAWLRALETETASGPKVLPGDICRDAPGTAEFDLVVSWAGFEGVEQPERALENAIGALGPGGVLYLRIAPDRAASAAGSRRAAVPGPSAPSVARRAGVRLVGGPAARRSRWLLRDWRRLFHRLAPGFAEFQEEHAAARSRGSIRLRPEPGAVEDADEADALGEASEGRPAAAYFLWRKPPEPPSHASRLTAGCMAGDGTSRAGFDFRGPPPRPLSARAAAPPPRSAAA